MNPDLRAELLRREFNVDQGEPCPDLGILCTQELAGTDRGLLVGALAVPGSQVEYQVAPGLGAADQRAAVGRVIDRVGGIADRSGHQGRLAGVAHTSAA